MNEIGCTAKATPSPHRFKVTPKQRQHQPLQSHDQTPVQTPVHRHPPLPPSPSSSSTTRQFNPPPRFASSTPAQPTNTKKHEPDHHANPTFSSPLALARELKRKEKNEIIETSSGSSSSDDNSGAEEDDGNPTIRKRRRLTPSALGDRNLFNPPQTPTSPTLPPKSPHPRFIFQHPPPPNDQNTTPITSLFHSLLLPPSSNPAPTPDPSLLLSPHSKKRGEPKYLPGGLAGDVRGLVISASGARGKGNTEAGEKLRILDVRDGGGGFSVLRGQKEEESDGEGPKNVLLINQHSSAAGGGPFSIANNPPPAAVRQGVVVALRPPVWEISLAGEKWRVSVDWRVV
ncbi:MAG: hypothetical protein M1840_004603 [Geoglossum simile]|nr:MAG: hypothetical protein M1840_004603 [Geoglossum simile]